MKATENPKDCFCSGDEQARGMVDCPECHGLGSFDVTHEPLRDGYTETIGLPCDFCQATGKVTEMGE